MTAARLLLLAFSAVGCSSPTLADALASGSARPSDPSLSVSPPPPVAAPDGASASASASATPSPTAAVSAPALSPSSAATARAPADARLSVAFVGDVSMSMHVAAWLEGAPANPPLEPGFPFGAVADRLRSYDLLVGNLECAVTKGGSARRPKPLKGFLGAPALLRDVGFDAVSVANNHTLDFGVDGFQDTLAGLRAVSLPFFGAHFDVGAGPTDPVLVVTSHGIRVALVGQYERSMRDAVADVIRARERADVVLVFPHWGIDYAVDPILHQRRMGRRLIDAGADAVIGAHPHVVQPEELYKGHLIAHSLGNFVFSGMSTPESRNGALIELDVTKRGVVDHRYRRVSLDLRGAPHFVGDATKDPPLAKRPRPMKMRPLDGD